MKNQKEKSIFSHETAGGQKFLLIYSTMADWIFVLTLYPIVYSFYLMFTDMNLTGVGKFIGLENLKYAFTDDPLFIKAFINTLKYVVMFVPSSIILAFCGTAA